MSLVAPARALLVAQAAVTALFAVLGTVSDWTFVTLLTAAGAVFVAAALQQTPVWRLWVIGFEGLVVAYGLAALVSAHVVPGAIAGAAVLAWLTGGSAARAFAGAPTFDAHFDVPVDVPFAAPEAVAPPAPVAPLVPVEQPVVMPQPRVAALDVLPRR